MSEQTIARPQKVDKSLDEELKSPHLELQEARRQLTSLAEVAVVYLSPEAGSRA